MILLYGLFYFWQGKIPHGLGCHQQSWLLLALLNVLLDNLGFRELPYIIRELRYIPHFIDDPRLWELPHDRHLRDLELGLSWGLGEQSGLVSGHSKHCDRVRIKYSRQRLAECLLGVFGYRSCSGRRWRGGRGCWGRRRGRRCSCSHYSSGAFWSLNSLSLSDNWGLLSPGLRSLGLNSDSLPAGSWVCCRLWSSRGHYLRSPLWGWLRSPLLRLRSSLHWSPGCCHLWSPLCGRLQSSHRSPGRSR